MKEEATKKYTDLIDRLHGGIGIVYGDIDENTGTQAIDLIPAHPILIGDVLEKWLGSGHKIITSTEWYMGEKGGGGVCEFMDLWSECGFNKSLQEIYEESGVEQYCGHAEARQCDGRCLDTVQLKSPEARALFDFLLELFPNPD